MRQRVYGKSSSRIKAVLVGAGRMGKNHLRVLQESPDFELVCVVERDKKLVHALTESGVRVLKEVEHLRHTDFMCAIIATPTPTHFEVAKAILEMGKSVLVEKPITSTYTQGLELTAIASKTSQTRLAVGHVERFNPAIRKLQQIVLKGAIGTPIHFNFTRVGGYPQTIAPGNNVLLDLAVHDIDILRKFVGPIRLRAKALHATLREDVLDTAEILLSSEMGPTASIHVNWITPTKIRGVRVTGTRGVCFVDYILQTCTLYGGGILDAVQPQSAGFDRLQEMYRTTDKIEFGVTQEEPLKAQLAQFASFLTTGNPGELCTGEDALAAVHIAEQAMRIEASTIEEWT